MMIVLMLLIRQIDYYRQSKIFPSDEYALDVYKNLLEMVNHIEKQAEAGCKFAVRRKTNCNQCTL